MLIDGANETVQHETRKQKDRFLGALLAPLATSLIQLVLSSVVKSISRGRVMRAGRGYMDKSF